MKKAFTLIELLIVITIIGILMALAIASYARTRASARDAKRQSDLEQIKSAAEIYRADNGRYPGFGSAGTDNGWAFADTLSILSPNYMNPIPTDPNYSASNSNCFTHYLYWTDGAKYTIFSYYMETGSVTKPVPNGPEGGTTPDSYKSYTIGSGACAGWNFKYWVNNP